MVTTHRPQPGPSFNTAHAPAADIKLLVISPVYGYPGFLPETLDCLLSSTDAPAHCIILADDGCDHAETHEICTEAQLAYPDKVLYRRAAENAGLAAARNSSVKFGLEHCPDLECIIFLDADDRVQKSFLSRSYNAFHEARERFAEEGKKLGWVFEDTIFFGDVGDMVHLRDDSPLWNLVGATHTSSSVMSADIFRSGHFYEESMKSGSEDWEFWLRAREDGFSGTFCPDLGFKYRRRPGSMSAGVARRMEGNRSLIRLRNKAHYRAPSIIKTFSKEAPPPLVIDEFGGIQSLSRNALDDGFAPLTFPDLAGRFAQAHGVAATPLPPFLFFMERSTKEMLIDSGLNMSLLEFATAHRDDAPILKHVFKSGIQGTPMPAQSGVAAFGRVNKDWPQVVSVSDRAVMSKIARRDSVPQLLGSLKQVNWSFFSDRDLARKVGAIGVFEAQFDGLSAEFRRQVPNSRRARWRPQGLFHSEVPKYLTGTKSFTPLNLPDTATLIMFDAKAVASAPSRAALERLIARERKLGQTVFGVTGPHITLPWLEAAFENIVQIPLTETTRGPVAKDEARLVSYALNFGRVVAMDVFAFNDGAKILKQNGIACELALTDTQSGQSTFLGLFEAFKAYSSVVLDGSKESDSLAEASGVAREKMQFY